MKIVFFGTEEFSAPTLRALIAANYDVACVATKPDTARGRGHDVDCPLVAKIARQREIEVLQPEKLADIVPQLAKIGAEIGVLVAYGKIIPEPIINLFPRGIVNLHPSLLPKYRGPSPIEAAIANGDHETGLTLMKLARDMDAGPIYYQEKVKLSGHETKPELYQRLAERGAELVVQNLAKIIDGQLTPRPQDKSLASYTHLLSKADGRLDPLAMTATECERKVRAYRGWPRTRLDFHGVKIIVTEAKVLDGFNGDDWPDVVPCANNSFLQIVELVNPKSGKQMKTAAYLRGLH